MARIVSKRWLRATWTAFALLTASMTGCGGGSVSAKAAAKDSADAVTRRLERRLEGQAKQIAELEVRLALLEAASNEVRALMDRNQPPHGETIRIGAHRRQEMDGAESRRERDGFEEDDSPRPVLRLHGARPEKAPPLVLPPLPPGVPDHLPVAPLPESLPPQVSSSPAGSKALQESEATIITEYRNALSLVRSGKFDEALLAFSAFIASYPGHAYTDNALYWRGEVLYAKRDYQSALRQFLDVAERFPSSSKLPESLLKIGMCHRRLGDTETARVYFRRVVRQYPDSNAARIASREDAS